MGIVDNKQVVHAFIDAITAQDFDGMADLMTEDGTWQVPGDLAISGTHSKHDMKRLLEQMAERFGTPVQFKANSMIGEGGSVAAQCVSSIDTNDGRAYRNRYHLLFEFEAGKIARLIEYCDTKHVHDIFLS